MASVNPEIAKTQEERRKMEQQLASLTAVASIPVTDEDDGANAANNEVGRDEERTGAEAIGGGHPEAHRQEEGGASRGRQDQRRPGAEEAEPVGPVPGRGRCSGEEGKTGVLLRVGLRRRDTLALAEGPVGRDPTPGRAGGNKYVFTLVCLTPLDKF